MQVTALRERVVADGEVLGWNVVPHEEIAGAPPVAVDELGARAVGAQLVEQVPGFVFGKSDYAN